MIPKFRAWQKYHKEMLKVKEIEFNKDVNIEAITVWNSPNTIPFTNTYMKDTDFDIEALILMQSTGLFDKNGVEIFEGDIIATDLDRPYLIVEKHRSYFLYNCNDGDDDYYDLMQPLCSYQDSQDYFAEVIGNVHENPELLEVEE